MNQIKLTTPLTDEDVKQLHVGDQVLLSGVIYTGRDAAHKRLIQLLKENKPLPFECQDQIIYYVGPAPAKPGFRVGSAGPTSSYRMDTYTPALLERGLKGMIGKGRRNAQVVEAMKQYNAVYLGAIGGAAALISKCIEESEIIAFEDLGAEAIHRYVVKDMPLIVLIDCQGNDIFEIEEANYRIEE